MQKACAPSATSTPTASSGAPGKPDGEPAGISDYDSKRRLGHTDVVHDERDECEPVAGNR